MKLSKKCLGMGAAVALLSGPAFAVGDDGESMHQHQQQKQQQQMMQNQQVQQAGQSSLIIKQVDDGQGGSQQEIRKLTVTLDLENMTDEEIEAAFENAEPVDGIHVSHGEEDSVEMRRGFHRGHYRRGYGPRMYGPRVFGPRMYGPRVFGPRVYGPRVYGPRYNPYYYGNPYYYRGSRAAWWLLPFLLR